MARVSRLAPWIEALLTMSRVRARAEADGISVARYMLTAVNTALDADDYCEKYLAREKSDAN